MLGLLLFSPFFAAGMPNTADGMLHLYRSVLWNDAWQDGILYPRWHTALYMGYGFPLFNFYAPLLYGISGLFALLLPAVTALKATLLLACLSCSFGMYFWARDSLGRCGAVAAAAAYTFATWRFRELFIQGNYAQFLAWSLFPWTLFFWHRLARAPGRGAFAGAALSLAGVLLSHNISAMLFCPFLLVYALWQAIAWRGSHPWLRMTLAALCALAIGLIFWLPALLENRETQVHVLTEGFFAVGENVLRPAQLLAPSIYLDQRAANPTLPYNFGRLHLLLAFAGALGLLLPGKRRGARGHLVFALGAGAFSAFMMLAESLPIWHTLPFIAWAEFPSRMYGVAFVFTSLLTGGALRWLDRRPRPGGAVCAVVVVALIAAVAGYQFPRQFISAEPTLAAFVRYETDYHALGTTSASEYLSRWSTGAPEGRALDYDLRRVALVGENPGVRAQVIATTASALTLSTQAEEPREVAVAQFYFPGWRAEVNGTVATIRPCTSAVLICLRLPAGESTIRLWYAGTPLQRVGTYISLAGVVALVISTLAVGRHGKRTFAALDKQDPLEADWAGPTVAALLALLLLAKMLWIGPNTEWFRTNSPAGVALPAEYPADLPMGDQVRLIGWDLPQREVRQGQVLPVRLYWQATSEIEKNYASFAQLIPLAGQANVATSQVMHPGYVPTTSWNADYYVVDDQAILVPEDAPPVLYEVRTGLSPADSQERIGEQNLLPTIRVLPARRVTEREIPRRVDATFANGVRLLGFDSELSENELRLTLYWQAPEEQPPSPAQLFVHALDGQGILLAQSDSAALDGLYPLTDWLPGEIVRDARRLSLPAGAEPHAVLVGQYDPATLARVGISGDSASEDNVVRLDVSAGR